MNDNGRGPSIAKRRGRRDQPVEVRLSLRYRFGDDPDDTVTVMDDRAVPMVDSVFKSRDRILRALAATLLRAGLSRPNVVAELVPGASLMRLIKAGATRGKKARK